MYGSSEEQNVIRPLSSEMKNVLTWIYSTNNGMEVNQNVHHTREEDKFSVELLPYDSIRKPYS
jgi:hypothetical protein